MQGIPRTAAKSFFESGFDGGLSGMSDNFKAAALNSKWTIVSGSETPITLAHIQNSVGLNYLDQSKPKSGLMMLAPKTTGLVEIRQALTASKSFIVACGSGAIDATATGLKFGVSINDNSTGFELGTRAVIEVENRSDTFRVSGASSATTKTNHPNLAMFRAAHIFLRVEINGDVVDIYLSQDGENWAHVTNVDFAGNTTSPAYLWLYAKNGSSQNAGCTCSFKWLRDYTYSGDFDPWSF